VVQNASKQRRDRVEADLLLAVVFAHMAYRTAKNFGEDVTARRRFIDTVRALYNTVEGDVDVRELSAGGKARVVRQPSP
jgi:hypothetical protein